MQQQPQRRPKKRGGFGWIGPLIFLAIALGPNLKRIAQNVFGGASLTLPSTIPGPLIVIGVVVLAVAVSGAFRLVRAAQRGSEMQSTPIPTPTSTQRVNTPMPPFGGMGMPMPPTLPSQPNPLPQSFDSSQQMPKAPRFEPIITGKAVAASLGLALLIGLTFLLAQVLF